MTLSLRARNQNWIDLRFHQEMYNICQDQAKADEGRGTCKKKADQLYEHVKRGRQAFVGRYGERR
jgi:hypothetical protein